MNQVTTLEYKNTQQVIVYDEDDFADNKMATSGVSSTMPSLRIDGKSFCLMQMGEKTPVGPSVTGVIVGVGTVSKKFYDEAFSGKENLAPTCAAANGETPDKAVANPICSKCALCPNNAWGSDTSMSGKDTKACKDHRRLVLHILQSHPSSAGNTLFRIDVPAASLKSLAAYGNRLSIAGMPTFAVLTKISFDINESYPKFIFENVQTLNEADYQAVKLLRKSVEIKQALEMEMSVAIEHEEKDDTQQAKRPILRKKTAIVSEAIAASQGKQNTITAEFEGKVDAFLNAANK